MNCWEDEPQIELDCMLDHMRAELAEMAARPWGLRKADVEDYFDTVVLRHMQTLAFKYIAAVARHRRAKRY
jgi:hypothetical protein